MTDDYRFRWYCDACREHGDWHESAEAAEDAEAEHIETHDELLYEPSRIQRWAADDLPRGNR